MQQVRVTSRKLKLSTADIGGHLRLAWLGVGSAFSTGNWQTNLIIIKGDASIMVDCGTLANRALAGIGLSALDIRCILPTHSHADHVGGIEEVALKWRYVAPFIFGGTKGDHKPDAIITERYQQMLWGQTLRGGLAYSEEMTRDGELGEMVFEDYFNPIRPGNAPNAIDRPVFTANYKGIDLKMMRTKHIPEQPTTWRNCCWSCGLTIDDRVLYPGDTRFDPELVRDFTTDKIETIFHDAQSFPGGVHAGLAELKTLPDEIRRRMYLLHLDDGMLKLDKAATDVWNKAEADLKALYSDDKADEKAFMQAHLAVHNARRAARNSAEAVVKEAGFAGLTHDATESYYDFA
ncbi:MAG: MBL fold metallo-hydrolase [Planctomycetota bacterium]